MPKDDKESRSKDKSEKKEKREKKEKKEKRENDTSAKDGETDAEVQKLLESGEWKAMRHETTGKTYYYHTKTKQTCWDLKKELLKQRQGANPAEKPPRSPTHSPAAVSHPKEKLPTNAPSHPKGENQSQGDHTFAEARADFPPTPGGAALLQVDTYKDPLERLMADTHRLEQLMASAGTSQAMAMEFQRAFDALTRTNGALTAQMTRMKEEYSAMESALRAANGELYAKDLALRAAQSEGKVSDAEAEAARTLHFLREQNRELVRQVGDLSVSLARGFHELSFQRALLAPRAESETDAPPSPSIPALGDTIDSVLSNPLAQSALCAACTAGLERLRCGLLDQSERAGRTRTARTAETATHHAQYAPAGTNSDDHNSHPHPDAHFDRYGRPASAGSHGVAPGYPMGYTAAAPPPTDTFGDHFPEVTMGRRSESRASAISASPVFGGFRIRAAYEGG